jgi:hypothetical protein
LVAMDVASFGSTEGRGHRWPASHRRVDGGTIKQDDCNDRDVSRMCRRAFAPPHAAYRAGNRACESHLCKSTLLGTVIATFFRVPTHSRRASRHSIGVKARHRWGSSLYRFHPLCTAKIQTSGAAIRWVPKVPSIFLGVQWANSQTTSKLQPPCEAGASADSASESSGGRGREKVLEEARV